MTNPFIRTADDFRDDSRDACDACKDRRDEKAEILEAEILGLKDKRDDLLEDLSNKEAELQMMYDRFKALENRYNELVEVTASRTDQTQTKI